MKKQILIFGFVLILIPIFFSLKSEAKDITIEPSIKLALVYDDNIDFDREDEEDDFINQLSF